MQFCALVIIPVTSYNLYFYSLNSLEYPSSFHSNTFRSTELLEVTWGCWLARSSTCPSNVHSQPQKTNVSWASSQAVWPEGQERCFCHYSTLWDPLLEYCFQLWDLLGQVQRRDTKNDHRAGAPQLCRQAGTVGVVQPGQEKAPGESYSNFPVPTRRMERDFWHGYELIGEGFKLKEA